MWPFKKRKEEIKEEVNQPVTFDLWMRNDRIYVVGSECSKTQPFELYYFRITSIGFSDIEEAYDFLFDYVDEISEMIQENNCLSDEALSERIRRMLDRGGDP